MDNYPSYVPVFSDTNLYPDEKHIGETFTVFIVWIQPGFSLPVNVLSSMWMEMKKGISRNKCHELDRK